MANLNRVRAVWTGSPVTGGGVSTFYVSEAATGFLPPLRAFFEAIKNTIASGVQIDIPASGDLIDVATGALSGTWSETGVSTVVASGSGPWVGGTGVRVVWATSGVRNGRRVRGSTFICPMAASVFDTDGTPSAALIGQFETAASTLRTALGADFQIYSRPQGALPGQDNTVVGSSCPNAASWLRSRRT